MTEAAVRAPERSLELRSHLRGAARAAAYLVLGLPLGGPHLLAAAGAAVGIAGPLRRALTLERALLNGLLAARLPPVPDELPRRAAAPLVARLPLALAGLVAAGAPLALLAAVLTQAAASLASGGDRYLGPWALDRPLAVALLAASVPCVVVAIAALESHGSLSRRLARSSLVPAAPGGAVREALAESLGDVSLTIAYWLPDREIFVDEHGVPVELPGPDSGRSWTVVENGGRRVAAIVHDAELVARPELVQAAASGAVLALENEQLKADLRARLEELRLSRKRIVQASVEARRRLERDLHDGAQQQLVSLSLDLQLLRAQVRDEQARELVDATAEKLAAALAELRELARGIHPAILTDRGLTPALDALAARAPLPVELDVRLEGRAPAGIEAAAYFIVAEALTNVVRYAGASRALVAVHAVDGALAVEVADDGVGGADPAAGSGLRGLEDRTAAVDGTLRIESPPGGGTRVLATLPLGEEGA